MGRNELIADYIFRNTGDVRTRKQVSSHIQVLKPFVQNEAISKCLCLDDTIELIDDYADSEQLCVSSLPLVTKSQQLPKLLEKEHLCTTLRHNHA